MSRTHGNASTYTNGCRCGACRDAWRTYTTSNTAQRVTRRASTKAVTWVRENRPDVWAELRADAARHVQPR